jgi:4-hydroxy-tetrahydrodipicolinate synthase
MVIMSRAMEPLLLSGVVPILMTPVLENDQLGWDDLRREVDFLLAHGTAAYSFGFGSEVFRLTDAERDAALDVVVERTAGRAHVIASVLAGSTAAAVQRAEVAKAGGAVAIMLPAPVFGVADQEALFRHYATVGAEVDIAIVVQDAPSMSGSELPTELLVRLAQEVPQVVALKIESEPSAPKIGRVAEQLDGEATVLGGGAGLDFLHELQRVLRLHRQGERQDARREFERLLPLLVLALRSMDTFLFVEKEILRRRGVFTAARLRLPTAAPEPLLIAELDALLREFDLHVPAGLPIRAAEITAADGDLTSEVM